jgi:hypothetical protein
MKTISQNRARLIQKNLQISRIIRDYYGEIIGQIGVSRNLHTYKYNTFFGDFDPNRKPIINQPLPDPSDESYATKVKAIDRIVIAFYLFLIMLPIICKKYPDLAAKSEVLKPYIRAFIEYLNSFTDGRWDRSMTEWVHIVTYAEAHGYNAASRKFSAKKDGKEKYFSPNYIKQKTKIIDKFLRYFENDRNGEVCHGYMIEVEKRLKNDDELLSIRKGLLQRINGITEELFNLSEMYSYNYYYIRHYDASRYKKSKSKSHLKQRSIKKRAHMTGKIECGPLKREDLPFDQIRRHKIVYDSLLGILAELLVITKLGAGSRVASPNSSS